MHRSILTGLFVCILSAALPVVASAEPASEPGAPAATPTTSATVATASATSATATSATEIVSPTDGADLVMWNATPSKADDAAEPAIAPARVARTLHLQKFANGIAARAAAMASNLTRSAMRFLGVPYSFGGTSAYGFDCSGYTQHVFASLGLHLPRTADAQYYAGRSFAGEPKAGDLVFFHTYEPGVSHVGISLGGDRFVHASSSHGVMISSLHDRYWAPRYLGAKRVVN